MLTVSSGPLPRLMLLLVEVLQLIEQESYRNCSLLALNYQFEKLQSMAKS